MSEALVTLELKPIDMLLLCPRCGYQHVDAPEPENGWMNPPHKSHKCFRCATIWRPADLPTNGVAVIATRGKADTWPSTLAPDRCPTCGHPGLSKDRLGGACPNLDCPAPLAWLRERASM